MMYKSKTVPSAKRWTSWLSVFPSRITFALLLTAALAGNAHAQFTATLTDSGTTAPIPGADDISQLTIPASNNKPDGLNYYFDNGTPPGQTFTTGANPNGYILSSVAIATAGNGGGLPAGGQAYTLRFYSISNTTATLEATYTSQPAFIFTELDWLQWTGLNLGLQPNTQYAYSFARNSGGWENLANVGGNLYAGGEVVLIPTGGGAMTLGSSHSYDASFDVSLTPATSVFIDSNPISFAPQNSVVPGTAVTISMIPAVGPGPLYYQWQTDGGTGKTLTNIPAATNLTLSVNTTNMLGNYYYALVVSNNTVSITNTVLLNVYLSSPANLADAGTNCIPGLYDVSQLLGGSTNRDGINYYDNNNPAPGQTFTTGSNPQGYYLNSVSIGTGGGTSGGTDTAQAYKLWIYSVNGTNASYVASYTNTTLVGFPYGDWVTWNKFSPLFLKPNSTYAYTFQCTSGWAGLTATPSTDDVYSGGQICLIPQAGGPITFGATGLADAAFDLGLVPVGVAPTVPFANVITPSPSAIAVLGTQVTLSEEATGAAPLRYQWQTDGGTGGALTNIPSSNATNLVLNTTGWKPGAYRFDVIVSNSYGSSTSATISLTLTYADTTAVITDIGSADPAPLPVDDISQLYLGSGKPDGLNYYLDNSSPPGQTFLTGSNPSGYTLTSLAVHTSGDSAGSLPAAGQVYQLRVYSVSGGNAVLYATYASQNNFIFTDTNWLRWSGLSLPLAGNATYAYSFGRIATGGGWENMGNFAGDWYSGGEAALIPRNGGPIVFGATHTYDATFVVGLAESGFPAVSPPMVSANNVYAGTPVKVTASVTGTGPFTYRWQTDGGLTGGGMTDIPGATSSTLTVDTTALAGQTVAYCLVASNGAGSTTSESVSLTVGAASAPLVLVPFSLPETNAVIRGGTATLRVNEAGTLPILNQWTFNGVNLVDNGRITGSQSNVLVITNVQQTDVGNYQLNLNNSLGSYTIYPGGGADQTLLVVDVPTFLTNGVGWVANSPNTITNNTMMLTTNNGGQASSFFFSSPVYIGAFQASFTYQDIGGGGADGFTFCLQNDPRGANALGAGGGSLAVSGITNAAELTFEIYNMSGMSFGTNGSNGSPFNPTDPVSISDGNPIAVNVVYLNGMLQVKLTDTTANTTYSTNMAVGDLTAIVGGKTAFMGITGASGGVVSYQTITGFMYVPMTALSVQTSGTELSITWPTIPAGYVLQSTPSLTTPNWQNVTATVSQVAGQNQVTLPVATATQFYRLVIAIPQQ